MTTNYLSREGRACGVLLDALYTGAAAEGMYKARILGITAGLTAFYQFLNFRGVATFGAVQSLSSRSISLVGPSRGVSTNGSMITTISWRLKYHLWVPKILGHRFAHARAASGD
jgi:hypothetical protein